MLNNSLSNRFQGAFLGFALGYRLGQWDLSAAHPQPINAGLNQSGLPKRRPETTPMISSDSQLDQIRLLHQLTHSILQHQGLDGKDYGEQWKTWMQGKLRAQTQSLTQVEAEIKNPVTVSLQKTGVSKPGLMSEGDVVSFALPLALLFHDNLKGLQTVLLTWQNSIWQTTPGFCDGVLTIASAIAHLLTQQLQPDQLIPRLLPKLSQETTLAVQLEQVQRLLEQNAPLETVVRQLIQTAKINPPTADQWTATALAFYCFLTTPEDYHLTVWRGMQTGYQPDVTSAISGALSGAYQGLIGIPVQWRLALRSKIDIDLNSSSAQNPTVESKNWERELRQLADQLLAVWSGVYHPITSGDSLSQICVTTASAASNLMRTER